ncbi:MAG: hypothetical protein LQ348_000544 [Seirophora lacunosa]|nr:MAG: hypothetical protein LQ348_000544 [Seirophora lacunosa]
MRRVESVLWLTTAAQLVVAAEPSRPRGIGPEHAKFYKSPDIFTCISNPSVTVSVSQINDDYCDCPDGSDEPGTSACSYLSDLSPSYVSDLSSDNASRSIALPGFYCKNKGHQPAYVPFLSVNDGVCDYDLCCDGSDEWAQVGGLKCENKCNEVGKAWRKQDEQRKKSMGLAGQKRKELVAEAGRLRKQVEDRIQSLETEIQGSVLKVKSLETALADAEKQERGKVVRSTGTGSKVGTLVQMAKDRIEELRETLVEVRTQRDEASARLAELEHLLTTFKAEYNPNFNDEGVKRAVRDWEEYAARDKPAIGNAAHDRDLDEISKPDSETGVIKWSDWEEKKESDVDVLYKIEEYLPTPVRGWVDQKLRDLRVLLIENGILAASADPGSESKHLTDARDALKAAQEVENNLRNELTGHQDDLNKDYGVNDVFRALKGRCISKDAGEYNYELCWLDRTTQKSKKGGSHTGMGNFVRIDSITVDDDLPPDGKGLGSGVRVALRYENGQHCWNGPDRSTLVVLACAEQDEVWKITEEEKCVYRMEVGTPAVCDVSGNSKGKAGEAKDEL